MRKAQIIVCENNQGKIEILYKGKPLEYTIYQEQQRQAEVASSKDIDSKLKKPYKPSKDHPWRRNGQFRRRTPNSEVHNYEVNPPQIDVSWIFPNRTSLLPEIRTFLLCLDTGRLNY